MTRYDARRENDFKNEKQTKTISNLFLFSFANEIIHFDMS
jgi:hypothetical protein